MALVAGIARAGMIAWLALGDAAVVTGGAAAGLHLAVADVAAAPTGDAMAGFAH